MFDKKEHHVLKEWMRMLIFFSKGQIDGLLSLVKLDDNMQCRHKNATLCVYLKVQVS